MAKVFPTSVKKVIVQQGGGGSSGGEVTRELLTYDHYAKGKRAVESMVNVQIVSQEMNRQAIDTVTAAVLGQANEINERAVETSISTVTGTANEPNRKAAVEMPMIAGSVAEMNRKATDATTATVIPTADVAKRAVEDISNTVTATAGEVGRRQADLIETVIIPLRDVNRRAAPTTIPVTISVFALADAVVSNTGFANPANATGRNTSDFASLTATSSGLAGTTSNTTSGNLRLSLPNIQTRDIPLAGTTIEFVVGSGTVTAGTLPLGQNANLPYSVSVDNGATFTQLAVAGVSSTITDRVFDITTLIGGDYNKLDAVQFLQTGSVTSGTGLGAQVEYRLFNVYLRFTLNKTY